ncbi:MAG: 50S ribosomal protein L24e [Halobacteriota archaeon]
MEAKECSFCGGEIEPGTGLVVVSNDGERFHLCSSKCRKNADLGREPRDVEWTETEEE